MGKRDAEERNYDDELEEADGFGQENDMDDDDVIENELREADYLEEWCPECKSMTPHQILHDGSRGIVCAECNHVHEHANEKTAQSPVTAGILSDEEKADAAKQHAAWERLVSAVPESALKRYTIRSMLKEGDAILHPKFGRGIVIEKLEKTKASVLFEHETKLLVCNK